MSETKKIGTWSQFLFLISNIIGSGIFLVQKDLYLHTSTNLIALACWCIGAVIVFLFGQCYAELGSTYPLEGGESWYLQFAYGKWASYFYSSVSVFLILPCGCALMMDVFLNTAFFQSSNKTCRLAVSLFFGIFNLFGGNVVYRVQSVLSVLKVIAMSVFILLALAVFFQVIKITDHIAPKFELLTNNHPQLGMGIKTVLFQLLTQTIGILWTFDGWSSGNFVAHRVQRPHPTFMISIAAANLFVWALYMFINLSFMFVIPNKDRRNEDVVKAYFACLVLPESVQNFLSSVINIFPSLGSFNGSFIIATCIIENYATQYIKYINSQKRDKIASQITEQYIPLNTISKDSETVSFSDQEAAKETKYGKSRATKKIKSEDAIQIEDPTTKYAQERIKNAQILLEDLDKQSKLHVTYLKLVFLLIYSILVFAYSQYGETTTILTKLAFLIYLFYGASLGALLILRKKDRSAPRPYKVYRPIVYLCIGFCVMLGFYNLNNLLYGTKKN